MVVVFGQKNLLLQIKVTSASAPRLPTLKLEVAGNVGPEAVTTPET